MSYTIGQVSQKMNISEYTIRYYEKEGLFPFIHRNQHGVRSFEDKDIHFLEVIICLKKTGMSLEDIRQFIQWADEGDASLQQRYDLFMKQRERIDQQIRQLELYRKCIDYKCKYYKKALDAGTEAIHQSGSSMPFPSIIDSKEE